METKELMCAVECLETFLISRVSQEIPDNAGLGAQLSYTKDLLNAVSNLALERATRFLILLQAQEQLFECAKKSTDTAS